MAFFIIFFIIFFVLPKAWLSYSMNRYDNDLEGMPFNAEEFGRSILKENDMEDVTIEETNMVDHYDLNDRAVRVKEGRLKKKSLTALAIICHEIGHNFCSPHTWECLANEWGTNPQTGNSWILDTCSLSSTECDIYPYDGPSTIMSYCSVDQLVFHPKVLKILVKKNAGVDHG